MIIIESLDIDGSSIDSIDNKVLEDYLQITSTLDKGRILKCNKITF